MLTCWAIVAGQRCCDVDAIVVAISILKGDLKLLSGFDLTWSDNAVQSSGCSCESGKHHGASFSERHVAVRSGGLREKIVLSSKVGMRRECGEQRNERLR